MLVEKPRLEKLESEEERPAYLYYRPSEGGSAADLRGQRQPFEPVSMSLSGDVSNREVVAGTHLTLTATSRLLGSGAGSVAWLLLLGGSVYAVFAVLWSARKY